MTKAELIEFLMPFEDDIKLIWFHGSTRSFDRISPKYFCATRDIYPLGVDSPKLIEKGEGYVSINGKF